MKFKIAYQESDGWLGDGTEIGDIVATKFMKEILGGKYRGVIDGVSTWINIPPPAHEEQIAAARPGK